MPCGFGEWSPGIWGGNQIRTLLVELQRLARSDLTIILQGESGAGKECFARALHRFSERTGLFVGVNCAAIPEQLAEAELFGHRKGAFTGAERNSPGYVRAAHGGTLLLDEIVELPIAVQAKLLRAVENQEVIPLGQTESVVTDVRWVAAAQTPLLDRVEQGLFRADLYARLSGAVLVIPPLRERREDIPFLFRKFLTTHNGGSPPETSAQFIEALCVYDWPLNVRELDLLAKRLAVLCGLESQLDIEHVPHALRRYDRTQPPENGSVNREFQTFVDALAQYDGNVLRASAKLGISRQRAYRLIAAHDIDLERFRVAKT
jgi:DNA-binding NtrC family response regulator